jgi:hypothetical protein
MFHGRQFKQQRIRRSLSGRPSTDGLHRLNVLPIDVTMESAPLANKVVQLRRAMSQSSLRRAISHRPQAQTIEPVIKSLPSSMIAPSLLSTKLELERQFNERDLAQKFAQRPSADHLYTMNVLRGTQNGDGDVQVLTSSLAAPMRHRSHSYTDHHILPLAGSLAHLAEEDGDHGVSDFEESKENDDQPIFDMEFSGDSLGAPVELSRVASRGPAIAHQMNNRPPLSELSRLTTDIRSIALAICPSVRPIIKQYEDMSHTL